LALICRIKTIVFPTDFWYQRPGTNMNIASVSKLLDLLTPQERRRAYLLLGMILVMALLDVMGVASIMPFMNVVAKPEIVGTNRYLAAAFEYFGFENTKSFLFFLGAVFFLVLVISIIFKALTTYTLLRFTHMRNYSIGKRLVAGYLRQPYDWFLNRHSADLGKTVLSEVQQVINGALIPLMQFLAHGTVALALLGLLVVVKPILALIVAAVLGSAYAIIFLLLRRYLGTIGEDRVRANRERFEAVQEAFGGVKDVKVAGLEEAMLGRFEGPAKRFARHQAASQVSSQLPRFALEIVAFGGMLAVVLYLVAISGSLQKALPVLSVFAFASYRLLPALQQVYAQLSNLRFAGPALNALHSDFDSLSLEGTDSLDRQHLLPLGIRQGLRLEQVDYTYPQAPQAALHTLTLEIPACTTVGFVGATGSGKTTTVDIILGLLRPQRGQLLVDGEPITTENVRSWQRTIGYVPQHIYLADDTVAGNIAFGLPPGKIDQGAVERAARIANLHEFVISDMPQGYATRVGERGVRLSGGQRQRVGIARALYHDPNVLVLDEATSALDNLTEQAVMEAVHNLGSRKTIIIIAHRLTTVRECDQIFVLEKGRLVGQGNYRELVEGNNCFRAMVSGHR
jgi:ABC-type multidrug transport system fused ATPase/permease subunit